MYIHTYSTLGHHGLSRGGLRRVAGKLGREGDGSSACQGRLCLDEVIDSDLRWPATARSAFAPAPIGAPAQRIAACPPPHPEAPVSKRCPRSPHPPLQACAKDMCYEP